MVTEPPLVIDLDGTLIRSDLLVETGLLFLRDHPLRVLSILQWLGRGKAALKQELALATNLDVSLLPYDQAVLKLIAAERDRGRRIILATASHRSLAVRVAEHLCLFDEVIATEAGRNLSAHEKRDALVEAFGEKGFDYAGNSSDDLPVWSAARKAYVVNAPRSVEQRARQMGNVAASMTGTISAMREWVRALRLHQWLKNLLVFVPLFAAHRYDQWPLVMSAFLVFLCFGLCASSVYILNDLLDLRDDRRHAKKRFRPFASGNLSLQEGLLVFPGLLAIAFGLAIWQLPPVFTLGLASYYALTLAYSLVLKRMMVIDVMTLAALYTLRIIVGAFALGIPLTFWILAFSMFLFLSLALVKRYAELFQVRVGGSKGRARGRGYFADDLHMISALGAAAGYMSVMVLALYINDQRTAQLYRHQELIWLACPLLLTWISRVWMLAHRGVMNEDPVIFAAKDRMSLLIGAMMAVIFWAAA